jgi:ABC-2 type transport system ATP-binding protein
MRTWWRGPADWRVDTLSLVGETDVAADELGSWVWDSADRRATRIDGRPEVRLPQAADLLPPLLGRRLAGADDVVASRLPVRRVAGHDAPGVRLAPRRANLTLVRTVDIWADAASGLPLRVEVTGAGRRHPSVTSTVMDLSLRAVPKTRTAFTPPLGSTVRVTSVPDLAAQVDRFAPYLLPARLGGLVRSDGIRALRGGGVATYGEGVTSFAVVPLRSDIAGRVIRALDKAGDGERAQALTPLVAAVVARAGGDARRGRPAAPLRPAAATGRRGMIRTTALVKRFGSVTAVDGVDLDVREGDRYGFLGPNGSGKTTTVRMLLGLVLATSGDIELLGQAMPRRARSVLPEVGALVEGPAAYGHLSGRTNLSLLDAAGRGSSRATRRTRIDDALEQVGLAAIGRRPVKAYSLGMRQRLGLAAALLRSPRLLVLDEPTNGLDPQGIREVRELLLKLNAAGTTVFLSSHLLTEIEALCTRVWVVDRGRLVLQDDLAAVRADTGNIEVRTPDLALASRLLGSRVVTAEGDRLVASGRASELNAELVLGGVRVELLAPERRTLEDAVLALTSEGSDRVAS